MHLEQISILNYKNIVQADLLFSPNVNCFVGANGQGKTNILDAIYYMSFCKSSGSVSDQPVIHHEADYFMLQGVYSSTTYGENKISCSSRRGGRKVIKWNDKEVKRLSEHWGRIPLVMISPSDSQLVTGGSEERRRFMDATISQYDGAYLEYLMRYEKALKQRNAMLKLENEPDWCVMDVLEDIMTTSGHYIYEKRCHFIQEFASVFRTIYQELCNITTEEVQLNYISHCTRGNLKEQLQNGRAKERIVGYTLHGIHKDDITTLLNNYPIKQEGSQGQTKTFFIAMKLAQFQFLKQKGEQKTPILLLDDIFDKLDAGRVARIIGYVSSDELGQIFITDTHREHLDTILSSTQQAYKLFVVENGSIK